jgi:NADPH:quinone reductase-like Zn-dependent oxidoreductase
VVPALVLSQDAAWGAAPPAAAVGLMQAAVHRCYGPPAVLRLEYVPRPVPAADEVLVRVRAAALNPADSDLLHGTPYSLRVTAGLSAPADSRIGTDFSGTVEAVGAKVTRFKAGEEVFGAANGIFALGASRVIDSSREDFTAGSARYNMIIDTLGEHRLGTVRRLLMPNAVLVMIGWPGGLGLGPLSPRMQTQLVSPFASGGALVFAPDLRQDDLETLADLLEAGRLRPIIERIHPLAQLPAGLAFFESGEVRGKTVIEMP